MKKNFIFQLSYQLLTILIPLITTPYVSRVLGAEAVGEYSYAYSMAVYFSLFILLGLANYGNRTIASIRDDKEVLSKTFWELYGFQFVVSVVVVAAYLVYTIVLNNSLMTWMLFFYLLSVVIDISWLYFGLEQFQITVVRNFFIKILSTASIFIFVKSKEDIYLYAFIMSASFLVNNLILWILLPRFVKWVPVSFDEVLKHVKPNLTLFVPVLAISLYNMLPKIMLGNLSASAEVGYYSSVEKILTLPTAIVNALGTVMLPRVSHLLANDEADKVTSLLLKSLFFSAGLVTPLAFGLMGISSNFVPWFFGAGFEKCVILLQIMMPSCIFLAIGSVIRTQYLIPYKKDRVYIESVVLAAICNILLNILLLKNYLSIGAAISVLVSQIVVCLWQLWRIRDDIELQKTMQSTYSFLFIGMVMYLTLLMMPNVLKSDFMNLALKTAVGAVLYTTLSLFYVIKKLKINVTFKNLKKIF